MTAARGFADGTSRSTGYDDAGRAVQTIDAFGHVTCMSYDAAGRVATGRTRSWACDVVDEPDAPDLNVSLERSNRDARVREDAQLRYVGRCVAARRAGTGGRR